MSQHDTRKRTGMLFGLSRSRLLPRPQRAALARSVFPVHALPVPPTAAAAGPPPDEKASKKVKMVKVGING